MDVIQASCGAGALGLGFIAPAFAVAGLSLASIPIIIHFLNRRRFKTVRWAAMEFLLSAMRKNRRRLRFEQWLLLAMRCAMLLLLGLALARPMGCSSNSLAGLIGRDSGVYVLVIDNSCSMSYEAERQQAHTQLDQAKRLAHDFVERLSGGQAVALITTANPATAIVAPPAYDLKAAQAAIDRIEQSYAPCDLDGALQKARDIADSDTVAREPNRQLCLFTDGSRATWAAGTAEAVKAKFKLMPAAFPGGITHFNLAKPTQSNLSVLELTHEGKLVTTFFGTALDADARSFGPPEDVQLQWQLDNQTLAGSGSMHLDLARPQLRQAHVDIKQGGPHVLSLTVLPHDRMKTDDTRYLVINAEPSVKTLIVEGEHQLAALGGSGAFLRTALAPKSAASPGGEAAAAASYVAPDEISDLELPGKVLGDYRAVALCDVGQVSESEADQLQHYVESGGALLVFMGDSVSAERYNSVLYPRHLIPGPLTRRVSVGSEQRGYRLNFQPEGVVNPILGDFAHVANSGLDTAQVYTYWQLVLPADSKAQRVLDFASPATSQPAGEAVASGAATALDPAITLHSIGAGQVMFFATSADPTWTNLPAKPAYVTLMHDLLLGTISGDDAWMNRTVGDRLTVPANMGLSVAPTMTDADGRDVVMESANGTYASPPLQKPGLYTLKMGDRSVPIAVNVDAPAVADLRPLDDSQLLSSMGGVGVRLVGDQLPPRDETEQDALGRDMEWGLMAALLVVVALECFLAMRFGHYRRGVAVEGA
jgi:hypothetical protein